jgi:hypothetical protein
MPSVNVNYRVLHLNEVLTGQGRGDEENKC